MSKILFDRDPLTGITEWFEYDDSNDTFTIATEQDVSAIVEANKHHQSHFNRSDDTFGDGFDHRTKVASIPASVYFDLVKRFGNMRQNPRAWKRWLNDPDNAAFRTRPGQV